MEAVEDAETKIETFEEHMVPATLMGQI